MIIIAKELDLFVFTDRSNSDGGFSSQGGIQRYTTSKYTNAIHAGLCTLTPTYDRPPRSTSSSSQPDYRVKYKTFCNVFICIMLKVGALNL